MAEDATDIDIEFPDQQDSSTTWQESGLEETVILLDEAIRNGDQEAVQRILRDNFDCLHVLFNSNKNGQHYFLHDACRHDQEEIVLLFLHFDNSSLYVVSPEGSPLALACKYGRVRVVETLLQYYDQSKLPLVDDATSQYSPFYLATYHGHARCLQLLLFALDARKIECDEVMRSFLLYVACCGGHLVTVQFWLTDDIDVNMPAQMVPAKEENVTFMTPLYGACSEQRLNVIEFLICNGSMVKDHLVKKFPKLLLSVMSRFIRTVHCEPEKEGQEVSMLHFMYWGRKGLCLQELPRLWLSSYADHLSVLDLSYNRIKTLSNFLPWSFPSLSELNVSHCHIKKWEPPAEALQCWSLTEIDASYNILESVPQTLFQIKSLVKLNLSHNALESLGVSMQDEWVAASASSHFFVPTNAPSSVPWDCQELKVFDVSHNLLTQLPGQLNAADKLEKLYASHNRLIQLIPPWQCPLNYLELSHNKLVCIPGGLELFWANTLKTVHLANNQIEEIPQSICKLASMKELALAHNKIRTLPKVDWWDTRSLERLDLSHNELTDRKTSSHDENSNAVAKKLEAKFKNAFSKLGSRFASLHKENSVEEEMSPVFPIILKECLDDLDLSFNNLHVVPPTVCQLTKLGRLNLSGNGIHRLPFELGRLSRCYELSLEGLQIQNLPTHLKSVHNKRSSKEILIYLKSQLRQCENYNRIKLVLLGQERIGKTSLLSALRGDRSLDSSVTQGVDIREWKLTASDVKKRGRDKLLPDVLFSTWDLAGGQDYQVTNQCFLSANALYVVVWDVTQRGKENDGIQSWLKNIQARAPGSHVIIVGSHMDRLNRRAQDDDLLKSRIAAEIHCKYPSSKSGNPHIAGVSFVSATTKTGITDLRELLYNTAVKLEDIGCRNQTLVSRKVPRSYLELEKLIKGEAERRRVNNIIPVILADDFEELVFQNQIVKSDIDSPEELELAAQFLHESGALLHFADQLRSLNTLYIIEPRWLCELLSKVVTASNQKHLVKNGILPYDDAKTLFNDARFPLDHLDQYIQLMERFDIAYLLNKKQGKSLLIPTRLPEERPGILSRSEREVEGRIMRLYKMAYIPTGFWSRLITRLLVSLKREEVTPVAPQKSNRTMGRSSSVRRPSSKFRLRDRDTIFWREGIKIDHASGYVLVETAEKTSISDHKVRGVLITVQSKTNDFSLIGSVVDQVEALITEWFPGMFDQVDGLDDFLHSTGEPLTLRIIPCPLCVRDKVKDTSDLTFLHTDVEVTQFSVESCAMQALKAEVINCLHHPTSSIPLKDIIPDLLLADLPVSLLLNPDRLDYEPSEENILGQGGEAVVYKGRYGNIQVAIKQFHTVANHSPLNTGNSDPEATQFYPSNDDTQTSTLYEQLGKQGENKYSTSVQGLDGSAFDVTEHLKASQIIRSFNEVRQEVSLLSRLSHPCVVSLIGASVYPRLCFALEMAPLGNLSQILEEAVKDREEFNKYRDREKVFDTALDRTLTYKIALQVASALKYLHANDIIYRDLKCSNILVWSLDIAQPVNVKISDYGISRFSTPQGLIGMVGTPGFQAPEVRTGMAYDEQVDIFSYAMTLFEIISGQKPFCDLTHSSMVISAVRKGIRPNLNELRIDTKLPCLVSKMVQCWSQSSSDRPSADNLVKYLNQPHVLCQTRNLPTELQNEIGPIEVICASQEPDNHLVMVWEGSGETRKYSIFDAENGNFMATRNENHGHRPTCSTRVGRNTPRIWVGNQAGEIEVFGFRFIGAPVCLWKKKLRGIPLAMVYRRSTALKCDFVYVSLDDGKLVILRRDLTTSSTRSSHSSVGNHWTHSGSQHAQKEDSEWAELKTIAVGSRDQPNLPAQALCLVNDNKELWVGCGCCIAIVDTGALLVETRIQVYDTKLRRPRTIRQIVCSGTKVWCINKANGEVIEINARTRQVLYKFDCSMDNPVNKIVVSDFKDAIKNRNLKTYLSAQQKEPEVQRRKSSESDAKPKDEPREEEPVSPSQRNSKNPHRSVILMDFNFFADVSDECFSNAENTRPAEGLETEASGDRNAKAKTLPSRIIQQHYGPVAAPRRRLVSGDEPKPQPRPRLHNITGTEQVTVHSILPVEDTIWVALSNSKILIVNVNEGSPHEYVYGQVLSTLACKSEPGYKGGNVSNLVMCGRNYVVSSQAFHALEAPSGGLDEKGQLAVWLPYGTDALYQFQNMWKLE